MKLDIATLVFITSIIFATQTIAVFVQYKIKIAYHGIGFWLAGTTLQALGFIFMLTLSIETIRILSFFANPLVFLGQILLYLGIVKFLEKKVKRWIPVAIFAVYIISYYLFVFFNNSILGRTMVVLLSAAFISIIIALKLYLEKNKSFSASANFTAFVFFAYGFFQAVLAVVAFILPPLDSYHDINQVSIRVISFIIPIVGSILWTFGFIIMVNQRLNAENIEKNKELNIVMKEVHHRIKNNMNTMTSLLSLQAGNMKDSSAAAALEDAEKRMFSMGLLYDKLYQSTGFSELSLKSYLPSLIDEIVANFSGIVAVKVEKNIGDFVLDAKRLQPLGIILNELLTNIIKYAFMDRDDGIISISALLLDGYVTIIVGDNGKGMPESVDFENSTGFGLMLVHALTEQLSGTIGIERGNGTKIVLKFKL